MNVYIYSYGATTFSADKNTGFILCIAFLAKSFKCTKSSTSTYYYKIHVHDYYQQPRIDGQSILNGF